MGEVLVITSGKGGVGKTVTTANLGAGLSILDKKVLVIDLDLGLRNLDILLGVENLIVYNLVDVIDGVCDLDQALIQDNRYENLYFLPAAQTKDKSAVSLQQMKKFTAKLRELYDYILLDCPTGIEQGFQNAIAGADCAIVVTTPDVPAIRDADRIIGLLERSGLKHNRLILNRIRMDLVKKEAMMSVEEVTELLAIPLIGVVPEDEQVLLSIRHGEPVIGTESRAAKAYKNICTRITGVDIPFSDLHADTGLFAKISGLLRKD